MFQRASRSQGRSQPSSSTQPGPVMDPMVEMQGAGGGGNALVQSLMDQGVSADAPVMAGGVSAPKRPAARSGEIRSVRDQVVVALPAVMDRIDDAMKGISEYSELIFEVHANRSSRGRAGNAERDKIKKLIAARNAAQVKKSYLEFLAALPGGISGLVKIATNIKGVLMVEATGAGLTSLGEGGAGVAGAGIKGSKLGSSDTKVETAMLASITRLDAAAAALSTEIQKVAQLGLNTQVRLMGSKCKDLNRRLNLLQGIAAGYALPSASGALLKGALAKYLSRLASVQATARYLDTLFRGFSLAGGEALRKGGEGRTLFDRIYMLKNSPHGRKLRLEASLPVELFSGRGVGSSQPYLAFTRHPVEYQVIGFHAAAQAAGIDVSNEVPNNKLPRQGGTSRSLYGNWKSLVVCGGEGMALQAILPTKEMNLYTHGNVRETVARDPQWWFDSEFADYVKKHCPAYYKAYTLHLYRSSDNQAVDVDTFRRRIQKYPGTRSDTLSSL